MEAKTLIEAIEEAGYEARSYSGRCMYGAKCVGVVIGARTSEFKFGVELATAMRYLSEDNDPGELACLETQHDSMGQDSIVYFPEVSWEGPDRLADDEEEEDGEGAGAL